MILRLLFSLLIFLKVQVYAINTFCFVLCEQKNDCNSGSQYNMCTNNCKNNLVKGPIVSSDFACYSEPTTNYLTTTNPRYQPAGITSDIPYNLYGTNPVYIPISSVIVTSSLTGGGTGSCVNLPEHNYVYYGDNFENDTFTVDHPGITGKVLGVRIIYSFIRLDNWNVDGNSKIVTKFLTNTS